ncbi:MAG: Hpt domain-containing protein, partial [Betaproteobacteria bacterium]|nr:Hpt domain-containing protein [Betaproteobacteria bacterium]
MAARPEAAFDIGPLSWVKTEIEHSLGEARTHLATLESNPTDAKAVKFVATHLHQVTGALSMVGLGAAARFNEEIEKLVATFESDPSARSEAPHRAGAARKAMATLSSYLDSLMAGEPDRPMMLARSYLMVNSARGAKDASESDLFSPDLAVAVPMPEDTVALPKADMMVEAIKQRRGMYQAGLLKLLREKDMVAGARDMRNATLAIEALQVTSPTRSFWYVASGFFDAVATNPGEAGSLAVQLFGKIDQQIKLLIDGVQKVPERQFRDLLLVIGRSTAQTERIRRIRDLYRLDQLLAFPASDGEAGDDQLSSVLRALREQLQAQKDNWLKFTSGNRAALEPFASHGEAMAKAAQQQPNKDLAQLLQMLGAVGAH